MEKVGQEMQRLDPKRPVVIPMTHLPIFRTQLAIQDGVERRLMFKTWGGLGDQICAEPTLRYALNIFPKDECEVFLASEQPDLFKHLQFKRTFDLREEIPNYNKYLCFETITPPDESNLVWQFFSHMLTNCVDFPSMCALRLQLPVADRDIRVTGDPPIDIGTGSIIGGVLVHPGKHWQSKTFPREWWNALLDNLIQRGITPVLIGGNVDDNRGTVDVDTRGCLDLRNKLTLRESIWCCQNAAVVLTNDSAPLHMAASGRAWIGYVATCKHPDFITHFRKNDAGVNEWQWRERNFGKGGAWEIVSHCPNQKEKVEIEFVPPAKLESWLPEPNEMAWWTSTIKKSPGAR